jgi:hypothetical protein
MPIGLPFSGAETRSDTACMRPPSWRSQQDECRMAAVGRSGTACRLRTSSIILEVWPWPSRRFGLGHRVQRRRAP